MVIKKYLITSLFQGHLKIEPMIKNGVMTMLAIFMLSGTAYSQNVKADADTDQARDAAKKQAAEAFGRTAAENNLLLFGIFPNTQGMMDGKFYWTKTYGGNGNSGSDKFSSGIFFDYSSFQTNIENDDGKEDTLTKEYRIDSDLFKGILRRGKPGGPFYLEVKPGVNGKMIYRNIETSGYTINPDGSVLFKSEDQSIATFGASAKLGLVSQFGKKFALDFAGEYIPFLYNSESGERFVSSFPDKPISYEIDNITSGFQFTFAVKLFLQQLGDYSFQGKMFRSAGEVASKAQVVSGNYKTEIETANDFKETMVWIEVFHYMTYLRASGLTPVTPIASFSTLRNASEIAGVEEKANTYKLGFLVEF